MKNKPKYTRADIVKVFTAAGLETVKARQITGAIIEALTTVLASGAAIELRGFGTFEQRTRKARTRYNPQTKEPVHVPARRYVLFRPGQELKNKLKGETKQ
jgi:DNA-binding protein HU-beta